MIMKPSEAAAKIGVHRVTFTTWCAAGHVGGAYRTRGDSGHWRIDSDVFDRWFDELKSGKRAIPKRTRTPKKPVDGGLKRRLSAIKVIDNDEKNRSVRSP